MREGKGDKESKDTKRGESPSFFADCSGV